MITSKLYGCTLAMTQDAREWSRSADPKRRRCSVIEASEQTMAIGAVLPDTTAPTTDWQNSLPVIVAGEVTLRELRLTDAPTLLAMLNTVEVGNFISPPPSSISGFERLIAWTHRGRAAGRFACFGIVPKDCQHAVGIIQVRALDATFSIAEWGFAIGPGYWGRGVFQTVDRQRPRQWRAPQSRRHARRAAAQIVSAGRRLPRSDHLVDLRRRLAPVAERPENDFTLSCRYGIRSKAREIPRARGPFSLVLGF